MFRLAEVLAALSVGISFSACGRVGASDTMICGSGVGLCGLLTLESGFGSGNYDHDECVVHGLWPEVSPYGSVRIDTNVGTGFHQQTTRPLNHPTTFPPTPPTTNSLPTKEHRSASHRPRPAPSRRLCTRAITRWVRVRGGSVTTDRLPAPACLHQHRPSVPRPHTQRPWHCASPSCFRSAMRPQRTASPSNSTSGLRMASAVRR